MMAMPTLSADLSFDAAARLVLAYLREQVPLAFWSVTRVENGRQTYLYLDPDNGYGLPVGGSHPWEDSFCIHMAAGRGPQVAPDAQAIPAYAGARVNAAVTIGSYAGAVISDADGSLFGAICGIDPQVRTDDPRLVAATPLLQLFGQLLTMVLAADRARESAAGDLLIATLAAETDVMTGLYNKRAWERLVAEEEARFKRFADPTVAVILDLDQLKTVNDTHGHKAGDAYIRAAAAALRRAVRSADIAARLGGDEFGLLMLGCTEVQAEAAVDRIYAELEKAAVAGSVGWAPVTVVRGLPAALDDADHAMYIAKRDRRAQRNLAASA
jgi:diguanylate cyclase (GGDEF)-like protein